jgi:5-amino-6-(5-phosphoribosylamino)uracil reductase
MLPPVRLLFPNPADEVDVAALYAAADRPRSPWVLVNMISTVDGATAIAGKSGGLGGPADKAVFAAIRSVADVILVGAGTVRAENYGPDARLAIVTASLDLEPDARVFTGDTRPLVLTSSDADPARRAALASVANVVDVNDGRRVDLRAALAHLEGVVLCEGGPSLNGQLVADDLVDELCLSLSPLLAAGDSPRVAHGAGANEPRELHLAHALEEDGLLFLRYVRSR